MLLLFFKFWDCLCFSPVPSKEQKILTEMKSWMKKICLSQHSAKPNIWGNRFIRFSFFSVFFYFFIFSWLELLHFVITASKYTHTPIYIYMYYIYIIYIYTYTYTSYTYIYNIIYIYIYICGSYFLNKSYLRQTDFA